MEAARENFNESLAELHARFDTRRATFSQKASVSLLNKPVDSTSALSEGDNLPLSSAYLCPQTGFSFGRSYVTSDDFASFYRARRKEDLPNAIVVKKPGAVERRQEKILPDGSPAKEGHIRALIVASLKKWFPQEAKEGREIGEKFRFPVAACGAILTVALSLGLMVTGTVMIGNATGEVGTLKTTISRLESEKTELTNTLDRKYDIAGIEQEAKSMGMVKTEFAENAYVEIGSEDETEVYRENESGFSFAGLLSAIGIR